MVPSPSGRPSRRPGRTTVALHSPRRGAGEAVPTQGHGANALVGRVGQANHPRAHARSAQLVAAQLGDEIRGGLLAVRRGASKCGGQRDVAGVKRIRSSPGKAVDVGQKRGGGRTRGLALTHVDAQHRLGCAGSSGNVRTLLATDRQVAISQELSFTCHSLLTGFR